ncbi:MAG TPA: UDP-N-acetylmuramoyl-L-alanyl-D-glutamate--2,6-diaminopimelate ligase [Nannocystaceae bacterium]|nr:UDP-N-acetylmuramoyl-L-alanyl-D-glutamate--2,6-diaminopimelate ligase [Nannocystaceae bacterium]
MTDALQPDRPTAPPFGWADEFFTFGITGTNGKTSTTFLVQSIVRAAGQTCLLIGTTGYWLDDELLTLPRSLQGFHDAFRRAHAKGGRWAACECTSHGLAEGYAKRWRFDLGVFTNLSPDHLSTHGTWEHYLASKAQLFVHLGPGRTAVLNAADVHALMIDRATPPDVRRRWFHAPARGPALTQPDLAIDRVELDASGTLAVLAPSELAERFGNALKLRMVGDVFAENGLAAALAGVAAGLPDDAIVRGLASCPPVPGRFEVLAKDPIVAVDYAHSPDALERTCAAARKLARGRVIVVFGAGGESTPTKRTPMGEAVGLGADLAIVTNDTPRREDPVAIANAVADGVRRGTALLRIELDRATAIELALEEAKRGDVVVIAGKGHEQGQAQGGTVLPFSDVDEVRRILGRA